MRAIDAMAGSSGFALPPWLDAHGIGDDLLSEAYESMPPAFRTAIKASLALLHLIYDKNDIVEYIEEKHRHAGFWRKKSSCPATWTAIAFPGNYNAPARIVAACAPPILLDVERVFAICADAPPMRSILCALDLCGVEDIFELKSEDLAQFLNDLAHDGANGNGRLILLHQGELAPIVKHARNLSIPLYEEWRMPRLLLNNPDAFRLDLLEMTQGFVPPQNLNGQPDAVYASDYPAITASPLILTPGLEGFWLHPGLAPDFFRIEQNIFGMENCF